ncbi:Hypothetical predicted protein, partial [Pelobates cultripes]
MLTNPEGSMVALGEKLREYGEISGYRANMAKFSALPICMTQTEIENIHRNYKIQMEREALKYLGISLTADP